MLKQSFNILNLCVLATFISCSGITRLKPCEANVHFTKKQFKAKVYNRLTYYYAQKDDSSLVKIESLDCDDYLSKKYNDSAAFTVRVKPRRETINITDVFVFDKNLNILKVSHELPEVY